MKNKSDSSSLRRNVNQNSKDVVIDTDSHKKLNLNTSTGFNPKIFPRPNYPPVILAITALVKGIFWQGGGLCTLFTILLYPLYKNCVSHFKESYQMSDQMLFTILISLAHTIMWIICNIPFYIFDNFGYFSDYKLYRSNGQVPTSSLIQATFVASAISHFITSPLLSYYLYPCFTYFGLLPLVSPFPSYYDLFITYCVAWTFNDTLFYWTHRLLHSKSLYFIHKQHHQYAGSMGIAAEYANPIESLVSNIFPSIGGVIFFGCHHPICVLVWLSLRLQQTFFVHSGYCFKDTLIDFVGLGHSEGAIFHDHHHTSNRGNFGNFFWDYMCGTMDHFLAGGGYDGYLKKSEKATTLSTKAN